MISNMYMFVSTNTNISFDLVIPADTYIIWPTLNGFTKSIKQTLLVFNKRNTPYDIKFVTCFVSTSNTSFHLIMPN